MPNLESLPRLTDDELTVAADLDREWAERKDQLTNTLTRLQGLLVLIAGDAEGFTTLHDEQQAAILEQLAELSGKALETAKTI